MKYLLGVDTGGTYTDAVVFDNITNEVLCSAKALTTKQDLSIGITNALKKLNTDYFKDISLVSLSTTLATNACVEGKGSRATLVLIGVEQKLFEDFGSSYGLTMSGDILFVEGSVNLRGVVDKEPDWELFAENIKKATDTSEAFAVVCIWGVRNSILEEKAKDVIKSITEKPVICGYELSGELNIMKRAAGAYLNAQLIPLINGFFESVKISIEKFNIKAPLVIVRGDGSLMSESFSRMRPVETLLCGPAASVLGGVHLSGEQNAIIVDMGGTTSDIAIVDNGLPTLTSNGAYVGKWRTGVKSIDIETVGLGGDSIITFTKENKLTIGPRRATPVSLLAEQYPTVAKDVEILHSQKRKHTVSLCQFFYLNTENLKNNLLNDMEIKICEVLREKPMLISDLCDKIGSSIYNLPIERLEYYGIVMRSALTPTDILHITGDFRLYNESVALIAGEIMAAQLHMDVDKLCQEVVYKMEEQLFVKIISMLLKRQNTLELPMNKQMKQFVKSTYYNYTHKLSDCISFNWNTEYSVVGIGAPIHIFLPRVAAALSATGIVPPYASVANAVGAATSNVIAEFTVKLLPQYGPAGLEGFNCYCRAEHKFFEEKDAAINWGTEKATEIAQENARERGALNTLVTTTVDEVTADVSVVYGESDGKINENDTNENMIIEITVSAKAVGKIA